MQHTEISSFRRGLNDCFLGYYSACCVLADVSEHPVGSVFWVEVMKENTVT